MFTLPSAFFFGGGEVWLIAWASLRRWCVMDLIFSGLATSYMCRTAVVSEWGLDGHFFTCVSHKKSSLARLIVVALWTVRLRRIAGSIYWPYTLCLGSPRIRLESMFLNIRDELSIYAKAADCFPQKVICGPNMFRMSPELKSLFCCLLGSLQLSPFRFRRRMILHLAGSSIGFFEDVNCSMFRMIRWWVLGFGGTW